MQISHESSAPVPCGITLITLNQQKVSQYAKTRSCVRTRKAKVSGRRHRKARSIPIGKPQYIVSAIYCKYYISWFLCVIGGQTAVREQVTCCVLFLKTHLSVFDCDSTKLAPQDIPDLFITGIGSLIIRISIEYRHISHL